MLLRCIILPLDHLSLAIPLTDKLDKLFADLVLGLVKLREQLTVRILHHWLWLLVLLQLLEQLLALMLNLPRLFLRCCHACIIILILELISQKLFEIFGVVLRITIRPRRPILHSQ